MGNLPFSSPDEDQLYADETSRSTLEVSTSWDKRGNLITTQVLTFCDSYINEWLRKNWTDVFLSIFNDLSLVKAGCFFKIIIFFYQLSW